MLLRLKAEITDILIITKYPAHRVFGTRLYVRAICNLRINLHGENTREILVQFGSCVSKQKKDSSS